VGGVSIGFSFKKKNQNPVKIFRFLLKKRKLGKENQYGVDKAINNFCGRPLILTLP